MDKKNTIIGVALLLAAFASLFLSQRLAPPPPRAPEVERPVAPAPTATAPAAPAAPAPAPVTPADATFAALAKDNAGATITTLANEFVEVRLTNYGGAIDNVAFKKYRDEIDRPDPYVFNRPHAEPILAFAENSIPGLGRDTPYQLVAATPTSAVYRTVLDHRLEVTRRFTIHAPGDSGGDPYVIRAETTFKNLAAAAAPPSPVAFSLGTAALVSVNDYGQYLNVESYNGRGAEITDSRALEGAGFIGRMLGHDAAPKAFIETPGPVVWASVKNQFFACIFLTGQPGASVITRRVDLPPFPGTVRPNIGLTAAERFELPPLAPGATATVAGDLYVGPKEYRRLALLPHDQDRVMQYDRYLFSRIFLSGYVAPLMNTLMNWTHRWVFSWGFAIILMTLILKTITLPFTLAASRSAKRMQKFQPEIQALREKFKDNPQKLNQAMMELFKEHKINPMGGCLPLIITMPLFFGFFTMLQSSAELRFQTFLWAKDLAAPDTVWRIPGLGFPLNIMPLLMAATMIYQMRLTPQPTVDSTQAKMMKFMPILFTLFCYNYSCALSLYMTINGFFTIGQQLVINRMRDAATDTPTMAAGGRPAPKNVTPVRKKLKK